MASSPIPVKTVRCQISKCDVPIDEAIPVDLIRDGLVPLVKAKSDPWDPQGYVSLAELNRARAEHVETLLKSDDADTERVNREIYKSIQEHELLAQNVDQEFDKTRSFGERAADKIAAFGGSWKFIWLFAGFLTLWMVVNTKLFMPNPPDGFPYIFLNLILSCLAAIQAPVIMMSQNRQEERDRMRGENDYKVNMKAEIEIRAINEKIDKLLNDQWKHLLEIQQMQVDMIQEMSSAKSSQ